MKKVLVGIGVVVVVVIVLVLVINPLSDIEKQAVVAIERLQEVLKDPNSLEVHGIRWEAVHENTRVDEDGNYLYVFVIDYSAKNSLGGMHRDKARVYSGGIIFASDADSDDAEEKVYAKLAVDGWNDNEENAVDVDKVMRGR